MTADVAKNSDHQVGGAVNHFRVIEKIRRAMQTLIPQYNTDRMVAEYVTKYYLSKKLVLRG